jgi:hypothetical protein
MIIGDSQSVQTANTVCPIKSQLIHFIVAHAIKDAIDRLDDMLPWHN